MQQTFIKKLNHLKGWKLQEGAHFLKQILEHSTCILLITFPLSNTSTAACKWNQHFFNTKTGNDQRIFWTATTPAGNLSASWSWQCKVLISGNWWHSLLSTTQMKNRLSCVRTGHQTATQGRSTLPNLLYIGPSQAKLGDSHSSVEDTLQEERQYPEQASTCVLSVISTTPSF